MNRFSLKLILVTVLFTSISWSQNFQGQAIYQTKTSIDMSQWGGRQMSEQQKKMIAERMKSMLEKVYVLNFNQSESTYREEEKLETPGAGGRGFGFMSSFTAGPQYKNIKEQILWQEQEFFGKQFLIRDSLPQLEWKLGTETKQIGQYTCFKAITTKRVDELDFSSMRRRGDDGEKNEKSKDTTSNDSTKTKSPFDEVEVPEFIIVTAWYTPQIPVSNGPGEYQGLPGLILEVIADKTVMLCTKVVLNPEEKNTIEKPKKGEVVTKDEYNTIVKDKIEEMRQMYGGRRGGRRN